MEQKSVERVVSQRAFQMGNSFPCQICVVGFLCGICLTSLFLSALTSSYLGSVLLNNNGISGSSMVNGSDEDEEKVSLVYSSWSDDLGSGSSSSSAPHLDNTCKLRVEVNERLDRRLPNGSFPPWTIWTGMLDQLLPLHHNHLSRDQTMSYPPWIAGSDAENYPLTRKVQRDLWVHQHPVKCNDPSVKFLVADWERLPGFGIGAQLAGMCGLLAIAINQKRVLVTNYYNRADHDACKGSSRASWSCYFFPETSQQCRNRAFQLINDKLAWEKGLITTNQNYTTKHIWAGPIPRTWGDPWSMMQPTTEINGSLIVRHRKMDRRWWRAQAIRYLMRYQSEYTCNLMNIARHAAFGREAAKMFLDNNNNNILKQVAETKPDIERFVWSNHKPWIPRPLLSMHVRMGDKACEMKVVRFEEYMRLAERIRRRFPQLNSIWLSTEMQDVIDKSKSYKKWKFYYTKVQRQVGNITMASYEASLGREMSTNYPLVNLLMATEADFFIGALGSTWCFLIDGMRNTGGKVMSGYLSVNKDRFW